MVARRRRRLAGFLCHGFPHPGSGTRLLGVGRSVQARAQPPAQLCEHGARRLDRRRPRAVVCALCAGAQRHGAGGRPALHRRRQAERSGDADGKGGDRRRARHARRPRQVRQGVPGRARRTCPAIPDTRAAASITARRCAMRRRWSPWRPKATRPS